MEFDIVLSPQQRKIVELRIENKGTKEIAQELCCTEGAVKQQLNRIKEKIRYLRENNIDINEIIEMETNRINNAKITVKQAQVLSNTKSMISRRQTTSAERMQRKRLNIKTGPETIVRKMSDEERASCRIIPTEDNQRPPSHIAKIMKEYYEFEITNLVDMATAETILRSYGLLHKTPGINRNNRKTSVVMQAQGGDKTVMAIKPDEKGMMPPGAQLIETIRNDDGEIDYHVFVIPGSHRKREKKFLA